jgi:hypothetical protein
VASTKAENPALSAAKNKTTTTRVQLRAREYTNAIALPELLTTPTPPLLSPHPPQSLPTPDQYTYLVITLPTVIPVSNADREERLSMSTIRGMLTNPHGACLLATYLMDTSIVVSTRGWKYVDKPGVTLVDYSLTPPPPP